MQVELLPKHLLVKTGPVDHADWNYRPLLGLIQRKRFHLIATLLSGHRFQRILEVGYGSGVFLPELARRCDALHGIDLHEKPGLVSDALESIGISAELLTGSVTSLPYENAYFDCALAVSALEYVEDIDAACAELCRVLGENGRFILVTPGSSLLVDAGLRILTGESARENYDKRREALRTALEEYFRIAGELHFPPSGGTLLRLYTALHLTPR